MKELLNDLACYHAWADSRLLAFIAELPEGIADRSVVSSFPTLTATFTHLLWAGATWRSRMEGTPAPDREEKFSGRFSLLKEQTEALDVALVEWVASRPEEAFSGLLAYHNTRGEYFEMPLYQCLVQLFNHGTYHRGQVVTMLRTLEATGMPGTDYITFKRLGN